MNVKQQLRLALLEDSSVSAAAGGRVFLGYAQEGVDRPHIVLSFPSGRQAPSVDGLTAAGEWVVTPCVAGCVAASYLDADDLAKKVIAALGDLSNAGVEIVPAVEAVEAIPADPEADPPVEGSPAIEARVAVLGTIKAVDYLDSYDVPNVDSSEDVFAIEIILSVTHVPANE